MGMLFLSSRVLWPYTEGSFRIIMIFSLIIIILWRQYGLVVRVKSGDPEFTSWCDHQMDLFHIVPGSTPLRHLVCLLPVGILDALSSFQ